MAVQTSAFNLSMGTARMGKKISMCEPISGTDYPKLSDAVVVHPAQSEVFPLDFEPILREDGAQKNDCERSAAKRLCQALGERYHDLSILLVEDALFANAPHLRQITGYGWRYVLNVKPDS